MVRSERRRDRGRKEVFKVFYKDGFFELGVVNMRARMTG